LIKNFFTLWSQLSPNGFIPLDRAEGGICTGQSNINDMKVRMDERHYINGIKPEFAFKDGIMVHFMNPDNKYSKKWDDELIKNVYIALCTTIEKFFCKEHKLDNFPISIYAYELLYSTDF